MSQITRCPFCATTFKVVADQLRISDGWVRCGQCKEVFDASEHLLTTEQPPLLPELLLRGLDVPAAATEGAQEPQAYQPDAAEPSPQGEPGIISGESEAVTPLSSLLKREAPVEPEAVPQKEIQGYELPSASPRDSGWPQEFDDDVAAEPVGDPQAEPEPESGAGDAAASLEEAQAVVSPPPASVPLEPLAQDSESVLVEGAVIMPGAAPAADAPAAMATPPVEPGFVKAARRSAFWRRPAVRGTLALAGLVLLLALGLQMVVHERDAIGARDPAARALLERLCASLQCTLQAPRRIGSVVIDGSSFLKDRNDAAAYQLQMSLKNTSALTVAMPALELTLTDVRDQVILRRVLLRDELRAPGELASGATWSGTVAMQLTQGAEQVAGYHLLAFYP